MKEGCLMGQPWVLLTGAILLLVLLKSLSIVQQPINR